nr:globin [Photobacterium arenosum]
MGAVVIPPERDISDIVSGDILDFSSGNNRLNAAGGDAGIRKLADAFCQCMETQPELAVIRAKYPDDLTDFRETLATFLLTWIRGEVPLYTKSNGRRYLNTNQRRVRLNSAEKAAWLRCMQQALDTQPLSEVFKRYVMVQLTLSAEMTRKASE